MRIIIIAGANGAGKTTFAHEFLPKEADCMEFVNADHIAAGLSPFLPESVAWQAARLMMERINHLSQRRVDFAMETTLSTRSYLARIRKWQEAGAHVELHFLKLPDADLAVHRVAERIRLGGHRIPEAIIRRRYLRGWENFTRHYKDIVDAWTLYDSSVMPPKELDSSSSRKTVEEKAANYDTSSQSPKQKARNYTPTQGGLAALTRAAEKAIARARAAGLTPVVRFVDPEEDEKNTQSQREI